MHIKGKNHWLKNCIGHEYVCVYGVGSRIVALKYWYLYFLPDTPETTSGLETGDEMLWNPPDLFSWHGLLVSILIWPICTKLVKTWNRLGIPLWCDAGVYHAKKSTDANEAGFPSVFESSKIKANGHYFTVVLVTDESWHILCRMVSH